MTSSTDAIVHGHTKPGHISTEANWSGPENLAPYPKSKMQAERAAWDAAANLAVELVTINPGLVLGPLHRKQQATSMEVNPPPARPQTPRRPQAQLRPVDVRDIAAVLAKARQELGWIPRPASESIVAAAESLIHHGIIPSPR